MRKGFIKLPIPASKKSIMSLWGLFDYNSQKDFYLELIWCGVTFTKRGEMRRRYRLIIVFSLLFLYITSTGWSELLTTKPEDVGLSSVRLNIISATLKADIEKGVIPGAVAMVARDGKIAYFESFGKRNSKPSLPMHKDTVFQIYAMTQPITSVGVMMLHEQGRIYLGDPLSKYIPEFKEMKVGAEGSELAKNQITIHDLLRHTSGLTYGYMGNSKIHQMYKETGVGSYDQTLEEMVAKLSKLPLVFQPGTRWGYSRSTDVLGRVIEIVSGMSLDKYFQDRILRPLKMNDTGFYVKPGLISWAAKPGPKAKWPSHYPTASPKALLGGEGLISNAPDYMRFLQMLMNNGQIDGVRLLDKNTVAQMTSDQLGNSIPKKGSGYGLGEGTGFGLGFAVREKTGVVGGVPGYVGDYAWMGAGGTSFFVSPNEKLCAIFMTAVNDMDIATSHSRLMKTLVMAAIVE